METPLFKHPSHIPLQKIEDSAYDQSGVEVWVKRDDLIHPWVSGNKYRKLKGYLAQAKATQHGMVTFGGAFSNHLLAVAAAGKESAIPTVGIVRGEGADDNPTLRACKRLGMKLHFVSREAYRHRDDAERKEYWLSHAQTDSILVPEGGSGPYALQGVGGIWKEIIEPFDFAFTAVGSGGTYAGFSACAPVRTQVMGVVVLKGYERKMEQVVARLWEEADVVRPELKPELIHTAHHGGYAKATPGLLAFIRQWPSQHQFFLDPIYTSKVFYHLHEQILSGYFSRGARILVLHTGGIQGVIGWNQRFKDNLPLPPHFPLP